MRLLTSMVVAALLAAPASGRADYTASVSPSSVIVTNFEGWGTSLCWWANVIGSYPNRTNYVNLAFNTLKLNVVRYNVGGGQNPAINNPAQGYRTMMPGFEPSNGIWNWNADTNQRWVLQQAEARGANLVEAFANSPPWWMCVNSNVDGNVEGTNNLQVDCETNFADYMATVVSNLTLLDGEHFNYVTPMNEPHNTTTNATQEFCHMSLDQQARLIVDQRIALNTSLPSAGVDAPQDIDEVQSLNDLTTYSPATLTNLSLFSTHTYGGTNPTGMKNEAASHNTTLWMSEYGDSDTSGMTLARHIYSDITEMAVPVWINWQFVDPTWGLLINSLLATTNSSYNPNYTIAEKFYVMGQFSEYIRPGYEIISVSDTNTLAAWNPANSTLVLVVVNNSTAFNVTYNLSQFGSPHWLITATRTASGENMVMLSPPVVANQQFTATISASSVTTFVLATNSYSPVITSQSPADTNLTLYAGETPAFSISAVGSSPLYYQWLSDGAAIAGATNVAYTPPGMSLGGPITFQCVVSNIGGLATNTWFVTVVSAPATSYAHAALALNPIGFWPLNEAEQGGGDKGVIARDYAGGNNGIYTNVVLGQMTYNALTDPSATSALFGQVEPNNSCAFDIFGPDFSLPNGSNAEFTVSAWANSTGNNGLNTPTIAAKGYYYQEEYALDAGQQPNDCFRFTVRNAAGTAANAYSILSLTNTGQWFHLVGVCDEAHGQVLLYTNGVLATPATILDASGITNSSETPMTIGARAQSAASGFNQQFPGYIADLAVYNYALSASQVQTLYQAGVSLPPSGLSFTNVASDTGIPTVELNWNYGVLQSAVNVTGPYKDVTNVTPPYVILVNKPERFFRIREN